MAPASACGLPHHALVGAIVEHAFGCCVKGLYRPISITDDATPRALSSRAPACVGHAQRLGSTNSPARERSLVQYSLLQRGALDLAWRSGLPREASSTLDANYHPGDLAVPSGDDEGTDGAALHQRCGAAPTGVREVTVTTDWSPLLDGPCPRVFGNFLG